MKARIALGTLLLLDLLLLGLVLAPTSGANAPAVKEDPVDEATDLPEGVSADWWAAAQAYIRRSEYEITWSERTVLADVPGAYQAPNRAQGVRTYFTPDGIRVVPRTEESPSWQLGLALAGYDSADGNVLPLAKPSLGAEGNSIAYQRAGISERYVNDEDGLAHQIILSPKTLGVTLDLEVEGDLTPTLAGDGTAVEFTTAAGVVALHYGDLQATDANGREIPVQLELLPENEGLRLMLPAFTQGLTLTARLAAPDSAAASGGGLIPSARWGAESDKGSAFLGHTVGTAGDVNGDGYADIVVGAYRYDIGSVEQGAAFVWYGSADGLGAVARPGDADWKAYGEGSYDWFGYAVGTAGDVDGDGYADIIVGARRYPNNTYEGAAYVWYGSDDGLCEGGPGPCAHDWKAESNKPATDFGNAVGTAGDVNGDGYDEVIVAAYRYESVGSQEDEGAVFLWYGSGGGLQEPGAELDIDDDEWADWRAESNDYHVELGGSESEDLRPMAGTAISTAGDVNGDGYDDVIVGAWLYERDGEADDNNRGAVFVWEGSSSGLNEGQAGTPDSVAWKAYGEHAGDWFGYAVGTAGDVDGDGDAEVIVGARYYNNGTQYEGGAFVWYGSDDGLGANDRDPNWMVESNQWGTDLGNAVGTAGDVNGDGYADIVVGAAWDNNGQDDEGSVFVWHGSAHGLCDDSSPCATNLDSADWWAESDQDQAHLGYAVGTAGDVNGDGYSDVIAGIPWYDNGETDEGGVFVWYGSEEGLGGGTAWGAESDKGSAFLGHTVGTAGDVNGDGYADIIVGAYRYDDDSGERGAAFVWYGSADGLGAGARPRDADWKAYGEYATDWFGYAVGTAGDVNGDGFSDVVVGARRYSDNRASPDWEGAAYVWYGSEYGLCNITGPCQMNANEADWKVESNQLNTDLGNAVGTAGDVDNDGFDDLIVAAFRYDHGETDEGAVFLWYGSDDGLCDGDSPCATDINSADWRAESNQEGAELGGSDLYYPDDTGPIAGTAVATAGDVNGDGYDDVIVGAWLYTKGDIKDRGAAFVWEGSSSGLKEGLDGTPTNADWDAYGEQAGHWFGYAVGTAGDVNGDGFSDIIVGARHYDNGTAYEGGAFVWYGDSTENGGLGETPDWNVASDRWGTDLGNAVGTAGDVNGDGYADVVVGAAWYDNGQDDEGGVFLWHGSDGGLPCDDPPPNSCETDLDSANWHAESDQAYAYFGYGVGTAGDVNGDGYSDLIAGAPWYDNGQTDEGGAFVWYGSGQGLSGPANWTADGDQSGAQLGYAVDSAGDINGDGYADVIVGAPYYDNGQSNEGRAYVFRGSASGLVTQTVWMAEIDRSNAQFGSAVAGAGDVNGDGYADVLIGAPGFWDGENENENEEGAAFVWLGWSTGLGSKGRWSVQGDHGGAYFGAAVAGAGDVNGDGYADILVGADGYDHGQADEGGVFLWEGSDGGLCDDDSPCNCVAQVCETDINKADWSAEGEQEGAKFGHAVGTAGDVNGDGLSDVLVGAPSYDGGAVDEGRAFLYFGTAAGLGSTPDWIAEGEQASAEFAYAVGTAGDVNGDGYSDVVIGAPYFEKGPTYQDHQEGGAFLWLGSATGLGDPGRPDNAAWHAEGNRYNAQLGYAVGTAGDVSGDGYADVVIGAPWYDNGQDDEGRALLYEGSAAGLSITPRWTAEGNQSGVLFGLAVAGAGDVDGNGFADVIVGAPQYNTGVALENAGRVSLYYGNGGDDQALTPRQTRVDGETPIAPLGLSDSENGVGLRLTGRTPLGRSEVKLQWQVAPLGTSFTATGIISGSSSGWNDTGDPTVENGVDIAKTVTGLSSGTLYHWRVRLLYPSGNVMGLPASRWVHMPWNGWLETDFRTGGCAPPNSPAFEWTPSAPKVGQAVTFSGRCYGTDLAYSWAFGDGHSGNDTPVEHTYVVSGTYNVTMTVTGQCGAPAEVAHAISVSPEDWWAYLPLVMR